MYIVQEQGGVHDEVRGVDSIGGCSLTFKLRYPNDDISPKLRKPHRKKVQDNLKQATINFKSLVNENKMCSSAVELFVPNWGPWATKKMERGSKRVMGDQMGGPVDKRRQNDQISPNELDSTCNF